MIAGPAQGGALALRGLIWSMVLASVLPVLAFVMVALVVMTIQTILHLIQALRAVSANKGA